MAMLASDGAFRVSSESRVGGEREEVLELGAGDQAFEQLRRLLEAAVLPALGAELAARALELLGERAPHERGVDRAAVGEPRSVAQPLPDLRARDLRRRGVLHQVVERDAAGAAQPGLEVRDADGQVLAQAGL